LPGSPSPPPKTPGQPGTPTTLPQAPRSPRLAWVPPRLGPRPPASRRLRPLFRKPPGVPGLPGSPLASAQDPRQAGDSGHSSIRLRSPRLAWVPLRPGAKTPGQPGTPATLPQAPQESQACLGPPDTRRQDPRPAGDSGHSFASPQESQACLVPPSPRPKTPGKPGTPTAPGLDARLSPRPPASRGLRPLQGWMLASAQDPRQVGDSMRSGLRCCYGGRIGSRTSPRR
jgi:hypothetical protein